MLFMDDILARKRFMLRRKEQLEQRLAEIPKGRLIKKRAKGQTYYYLERDGELQSLQDKPETRALYEEKQTAEKELKNLNRNITAIDRFLKQYIPMSPEETKRQVQGRPWEEVKGQQNSFNTDNRELVYLGVLYHSKSEMLIAIMLTSFGIEFKYEILLKEGYRKVYPDFVIRRPRDGRIMYWEHAGVTHKEEYIMKLYGRLDEYHAMGIDLWDNLILSFDGPDGSLNADQIEKIIRLYLL